MLSAHTRRSPYLMPLADLAKQPPQERLGRLKAVELIPPRAHLHASHAARISSSRSTRCRAVYATTEGDPGGIIGPREGRIDRESLFARSRAALLLLTCLNPGARRMSQPTTADGPGSREG
jgi:hypothetical protein